MFVRSLQCMYNYIHRKKCSLVPRSDNFLINFIFVQSMQAPTTTTALLATVPKIGVLSILVQIGPVTNVVLVCTVLLIVYGAIGALNQTKKKRLLAYSGIDHMGFILFGVAIGSFESIQASLIYIWLFM